MNVTNLTSAIFKEFSLGDNRNKNSQNIPLYQYGNFMLVPHCYSKKKQALENPQKKNYIWKGIITNKL